MKARNFSLIFEMLILSCTISIIHGEAIRKLYPDTNTWWPFIMVKGWSPMLPYENYLIVYYGQDVEYSSGYSNEFRKSIDYILNGEENKTRTDPLSIKASSPIQIYLSKPLTTLENFFDLFYDEKVEYLISVDLSHTDMTEITSLANMFSGCLSLKSITPPKYPSLQLQSMESMFEECSSLISIDLSQFYTNNVTNMNNLFFNCKSLKVIDMTCYGFENLKSTQLMFYGTENLKKIDFRTNVVQIGMLGMRKIPMAPQNIIGALMEISSSKEDLLICSEEYFSSSCCDYNLETDKCEIAEDNSPHITVYYWGDAKYSKFETFMCEGEDDDCYNIIEYLKVGDLTIDTNTPFEVKKGTKMEIYFSSYFNGGISEFFYNNGNIMSVDLSTLNSSAITAVNSLFYNCKNLISLNMSHFSKDKVVNLNYFCSGCDSLKLLDISGIDLSAATSSIQNAFSQLYNLKYLNIKNSTISEELLQQIPKKNLIVCQDGNLIEDDNIINDCCDPNKDLEECHTSNHIIIYYSKECNSNLGYGWILIPLMII